MGKIKEESTAYPYLSVMLLFEIVPFRNKFVANLSQYVVLP